MNSGQENRIILNCNLTCYLLAVRRTLNCINRANIITVLALEICYPTEFSYGLWGIVGQSVPSALGTMFDRRAVHWEQAWGGEGMGNAGCDDGWLRNVVSRLNCSFGPPFCTLVPVGRKCRRMGWQTSRAQPRQVPPEQLCLILMGHTGKRDKEDGFAQSQVRVLEDCLWTASCRALEVRARSSEPHLLLMLVASLYSWTLLENVFPVAQEARDI